MDADTLGCILMVAYVGACFVALGVGFSRSPYWVNRPSVSNEDNWDDEERRR